MKKLFWLTLGILSPLPALFMYFGTDFSHVLHPFSLSMFVGLISYTYFLISLLISTRIGFFDKIYGHDKVMKFHSLLAIAALVLAFVHRQIKEAIFPYTDTQVLMGTLAFLTFLAITFITVFIMVPNLVHQVKFLDKFRIFANKKMKLDYSILKVVHNFFIVAIMVLSVHIFLASSTQENWMRMGYVMALGIFTFFNWLKHKIIKPFLNRQKEYAIKKVSLLNESIVEIEVEATGKKKLPHYKAGQFCFFRFPETVLGNEEHPFTLSSSPNEKHITITAKNLGDYTAKLNQLKPGDKAVMDGPFGKFNVPAKQEKPLVFIAGGIGITPFVSILKTYKPEVKTTLLWGVRNNEDLVYHDLFKKIESENEKIDYVPVVSDQKDLLAGAKSGFIDDRLLKEELGEKISEASIYFCGPPLMKKLLLKSLKRLGVKKKNIHYEEFSLG